MRFLILFLAATSLFAQVKAHQLDIIVNPSGAIPGRLVFATTRSDGKFVTIQAPDVASATYALTFPVDTPATNGECLKSSTAGVLSFGACGSSQWVTSGSDIYYSAGAVTVGGTTPDTTLTVVTGINGGVSISDGTARGIMYASGVLTNSIVFGTTSAHPLAIYAGNNFHSAYWPSGNSCVGCSNDTYKWEVNGTFRAAGAATMSGGATFGGSLAASATDTHDIGSSTRFRNIYGQAVNAANIEVANGTTVTSFWRHRLTSASAYLLDSGAGTQTELAITAVSSSNTEFGIRGTLYPLNVGGSNGDLGYSGTPWRNLYLSTGFRLTSGAAAGRVLTSNGGGDGTWEPLGACATCVTTNTNQTITGTKTFTASIAATTTDTYDIGSSTRFRNIYGQFVNTANLEIANGTTVTSFWRHRLSGASAYLLDSGSGGQTEMSITVVSSSNTEFGIRGTLYPLNVGSSNGDLGYSGTPWRTLYLSTSAFMNGTQWMDSSRNLTNLGTGTFSGAITANGGISTASGTNSTMFVGSGNFYIRTFSGGDASCSGVTNGWIGFRTDTDELQVCNGGATRKVAM